MFYVLEVTQTKQADGTVKTEKGVYSYETEAKAIANFHKKMGAWSDKDECVSQLCMVIGDDGAVYRSEKYVKPAEQAEPATEA